MENCIAANNSKPSYGGGISILPDNTSGGTTDCDIIIPGLGSVLGDNTFSLVAEDVTPAPYNQPPYAPAGDTDSAQCVVTAAAP